MVTALAAKSIKNEGKAKNFPDNNYTNAEVAKVGHLPIILKRLSPIITPKRK